MSFLVIIVSLLDVPLPSESDLTEQYKCTALIAIPFSFATFHAFRKRPRDRPLSALESLPDPVLLRILEHLVDVNTREDPFSCAVQAFSLVSASQVSRRLRSLSIGHGKLWGQIIQLDFDSFEELGLYLERSNGSPLYFTSALRCDFSDERGRVWDLAIAHIQDNMCGGLFLSFEPSVDLTTDPRPITSLIRSAKPVHVLKLSGITVPELAKMDAAGVDGSLFHEEARITTLSLTSAPTWLLSPITPAFQHLTTIHVAQEQGFSEHKLSAAQWLGILYTIRTLEVLKLVHAVRTPPFTAEVIPSIAHCPPRFTPSLPRLHTVEITGDIVVNAPLIKQTEISARNFSVDLCWGPFPEWVDPISHVRHDNAAFLEGVRSVMRVLPRATAHRRIWSISLEDKAFSLTVWDSGHASKYAVRVQITRTGLGLLHRNLDEALAAGLSAITAHGHVLLKQRIFDRIEFVSLSTHATCMWLNSPYTTSVSLQRILFLKFLSVHTLYINHEILERNHAEKFLLPTSFEERESLRPFPGLRFIHVDISVLFSNRATATLTKYLLWRRKTNGVTEIEKLFVWAAADLTEQGDQALEDADTRVQAVIAGKEFRRGIRGAEVVLVPRLPTQSVESLFCLM